MSKKIWEGKAANKGNVVRFMLKNGNRVVGFYLGKDGESYEMREDFKGRGKSYSVRMEDVMHAKVLEWGSFQDD